MFSGTRSSIRRLSAAAMLVSLGVFILLVVVGGSTAHATLSDGDVVLGAAPLNACTPGTNVNCTSSLTGIVNTTSGGDAFHGFSASGIGVGGFSTSGKGIKGEAGNGTGVQGESICCTGVRGVSSSGEGVHGESTNGTGVDGASSSGNGVFGLSTSSDGVLGWTNGTGKAGVRGEARTGSAIGVQATNGGNAGATALKATGKTSFSRSGTLTVSAGTSAATKAPISLTSASLVLTTIQGNQPGVYVQGVTKVTGTSGSFTIHLNKNTTANLPVAWFVVN